ncbi:hypothetical protein E2562_037159 [Oryza meyeriana var. granulata]|uniref:Uncharacterized protein n=1 Tax=Oryza meyeriana var. granulata TaxID=110450 RepID=A0A6G1CLC3_9ORYZ|nr:hypothetical protein E2562_037159 [Oryza meyeriana var. granulata]
MEVWQTAHQKVHVEEQSYDPTTYQAYLQWYIPRTHVHYVRLLAGEQAKARVTDTYLTNVDTAWHEVVTTQEVLGALGSIFDKTAHAIRGTSCRHPQQVVKPIVVPQFRPTGTAGVSTSRAPPFDDFAHTNMESDRQADDYFATYYWLTAPTQLGSSQL